MIYIGLRTLSCRHSRGYIYLWSWDPAQTSISDLDSYMEVPKYRAEAGRSIFEAHDWIDVYRFRREWSQIALMSLLRWRGTIARSYGAVRSGHGARERRKTAMSEIRRLNCRAFMLERNSPWPPFPSCRDLSVDIPPALNSFHDYQVAHTTTCSTGSDHIT